MDERLENISIDSLVSRTKRLGWQGDKVRLDVDTNKEGASKLMLIGKILSKKSFQRNPFLALLLKILCIKPGV